MPNKKVCCKKRENLDDKRAGKRYFERFSEMLLNMKCSLTENRNYVILFLKNRQEGTKLSPEEEKVQRLEQRIAQLEQALQEKNAPASSQPPVPPTMPHQEAPPTILPPARYPFAAVAEQVAWFVSVMSTRHSVEKKAEAV